MIYSCVVPIKLCLIALGTISVCTIDFIKNNYFGISGCKNMTRENTWELPHLSRSTIDSIAILEETISKTIKGFSSQYFPRLEFDITMHVGSD